MAIAGNCWDFSLFALSTAAWQFAREKIDFWVAKIIFVKLDGDLLGFPAFCVVYCCSADGREKMILGSGKSFFPKATAKGCSFEKSTVIKDC